MEDVYAFFAWLDGAKGDDINMSTGMGRGSRIDPSWPDALVGTSTWDSLMSMIAASKKAIRDGLESVVVATKFIDVVSALMSRSSPTSVLFHDITQSDSANYTSMSS